MCCFVFAAPDAPPQQVTVATVGSHNSTSISVSWDPPPLDEQNGIIQQYTVELTSAIYQFIKPRNRSAVPHRLPWKITNKRLNLCQIWCSANETRFQVNKSVDATIRSVVVGGLQTGVQYHVEVAAGTSAGVGVRSKPQLIILGNPLTIAHIHMSHLESNERTSKCAALGLHRRQGWEAGGEDRMWKTDLSIYGTWRKKMGLYKTGVSREINSSSLRVAVLVTRSQILLAISIKPFNILAAAAIYIDSKSV